MYLQYSPPIASVVAGFFLLTSFAVSQEHYPEVTLEEVKHFNATCPFSDNCGDPYRNEDSLKTYDCNCKEFCDEYDTCCVDSEHRVQMSKVRKPYKCVRIYGTDQHAFMINSCQPSWNGDHMEDFCKASAEELDDIFSTVPVTNNKTRITYKNYACALCNNETDLEQLVFWPMFLKDRSNMVLSKHTTSNIPNVHYSYSAEAWLLREEADNIERKVVIPYFDIPNDIEDNVFHCFPGVISECATNWTDTNIKDKCGAYMALVRAYSQDGSLKIYRNPHCAVCNYQYSKYHFNCYYNRPVDFHPVSHAFFTRLFSLYDKESKCDDDQIYDTIAKKCRKVYRG